MPKRHLKQFWERAGKPSPPPLDRDGTAIPIKSLPDEAIADKKLLKEHRQRVGEALRFLELADWMLEGTESGLTKDEQKRQYDEISLSAAHMTAVGVAMHTTEAYRERAKADPDEKPFLKRIPKNTKHFEKWAKTLTEAIRKDVFEALRQGDTGRDIFAYIHRHAIAWALRDISKQYDRQTLEALPDNEYKRLLRDETAKVAHEEHFTFLGQYAVAMTRAALEAMDPDVMPLPELRAFLGLDPKASERPKLRPTASPDPFQNALVPFATGAPVDGAIRAIFQARTGWTPDEDGRPRYVHKVEGPKFYGMFSYHIMLPDPSGETLALAQKQLAEAILQDMGADTAWLHMALLAYAAQTHKDEQFVIPRQAVYRVLGLDKRTDLTRNEKDERSFAEMSRLMSLGVAIMRLQLDGRQLDYNRRIGRIWDIGWDEYGQSLLTPEQVGQWTRKYQDWQLVGRPGVLWADLFLYGEPMRQFGTMARDMIDSIDRRKAPLSAGLAVQLVFQSRFSPGEAVRIRNRDIIEFTGGKLQPEDRRLRHEARVQVMDAIWEQERWGWGLDFSEWPEDLRPDFEADRADAMLTGDGSEAAADRWPEGYWDRFINATTHFITPAPILEANLKATRQLPAPEPRRRQSKRITASAFKETRQALKWTQKDVAQYLGVSQQLVSHMETGRRDIKAVYMRKLERALSDK